MRRAHKRIGRRGAILISFGIAWLAMAGAILEEDPGLLRYRFGYMYLPVWLRASLWALTGLVAIASAWRPQGKSDSWGFVALYIMPAQRAAAHLIAWMDSLDGKGGDHSAWVTTIFYLIFLAVIIICAGWKEPLKREDLPK